MSYFLSSSLLQQKYNKRSFKMNKRPSSVFLAIIALLGIFLLSCAPCQGSSLHVRREISARRQPYQLVQLQNGDTDQLSQLRHSISKRDVASASPDSSSADNSTSSSHIKGTAVALNDSHNQLLVFWAGEDVILCLAKDATNSNVNGSSTLWISRDYGATFTDVTSLLMRNQTGGSGVNSTLPPPVLEGFFNHPSNNGHFAFTDIIHKVVYTTKNYGAEFTANKVDFVPDEVLFDPHSDSNIVAYEKSTTMKKMWVSIDFGKTWRKVQDYVKTLEWDESVMPAVLYLQRKEPSSTPGADLSVILKSDSLFLEAKDTEVIISDVEEFEIKDEFMFATQAKGNGTYDLLISYKKSSFKKALFPSNIANSTKHFFIADVSSDGQIFVCVVLNESVSNLYIGDFLDDEEGPKFSLSLERILYFKPNVTWSESWLNEVSQEPFVDLHHVEGLRGVYIASQLKPSTVTNGKFNMNEVISLITYDQGGEWAVLNPPEFEHDGRPIYCQYSGGNCSLHISQRLSELYPRTRAVPVLSKKSAVGVVLATGTVNTTLKGHLGVYLSTDGAVSWRQVLQGNYLYAFGDHGGIIVATKMYRIGDDTNELIYSIDEGETWEKYQFYKENVRIMGLMTEPGENTTTFFIFGSVVPPKSNAGDSPSGSKHTWVLIKVDFRDAFDRDCVKEDYKMWSPWDGEDGKQRRQCLLGRKQYYERRIPTHRCYNGRNYMRPVTNETCLCKRKDFECDFGYVVESGWKAAEDPKCVKDTSESSPGVKAEWCRPSETGLPAYYNKTRGYRKIPGDTCKEGGWVATYLPEPIPCEVKAEPEFMLVAKRDSVLRIDLNHLERVETLPLTRVKAVIAVDFNLRNNCIYWSDVQQKTIMMLHLDGNSTAETLVSYDLTSVEGLAFDWMANNLYFSDGGGSKIEVVRVDNRKMRKRLLTKPQVEKPRGLAVHPEKGYIFWTDWSTQNPGIGRAHLDGSNYEMIIKNKASPNGQALPAAELTIKWPNGITIDFQRNRLFWVDGNLDKMFTSDLNGGNIQVVLEKNTRISHAFAVGVYKTNVYWDDWTTRGIYGVPLERLEQGNFSANADSIFKIKGDLPRLMDLKVYGVGMQREIDNNLCRSETRSNCSHLCFARPNGSVSCECPDGFQMQNGTCLCPDGKAPSITNGTHTCESKCDGGPATFRCRTHKDYCIIAAWRCDGEDDCGDMSDEEGCDSQVCNDPTEFKCNLTGRCIPPSFRCDHDHDCGPGDTSDEENCPAQDQCDPQKHFTCANGRCILKSWRCDEDDDCLDGSDEKNCTEVGRNGTFACLPTEWKCPNENKCLSPDWICDFDHDCQDGADETNCTGRVCPDWKFACNNTGHCIMKNWECDGDPDCPDGSDEHPGCPPSTTILPTPENPFRHGNCSQMSQMFECLGSKECIPVYWKCDHVKDCRDGSDEVGCPDESTEGDHDDEKAVTPETAKCEMDQWRCNDGNCIASYAVCDGFPDCTGKEDESSCHNDTFGGCPEAMHKCGPSRVCIPREKWCDKKFDCPNRADEADCGPIKPMECNSGQMKCADDCVPLFKQCNGKKECVDGSDEKDEICSRPGYQRVHQVEGISFPETDSTWFEMDWWLPATPSGKRLQFIPEICEVESTHCWNMTAVNTRQVRVEDGLHPFKTYSVTVYVKDPTVDKVFPPYVYTNVTTAEDISTAPFGLSVSQNSTEDLIIKWKRPHTPNGRLKGYKVYFQPPLPPASIDADKETLIISNKQSNPNFLAQEQYQFWVTAINGRGEGKASEVFNYTYDGEVAFMSEMNVKGVTENSVKFSWNPSNENVDKYTLLLQTDVPGSMYTFRNKTETNKKFIEFDNLSPGTPYKLTIIPMFNTIHGVHRTVSFTTKGNPLPTVDGFSVTEGPNGKAKLSWRGAKVSADFRYGIYYGKTAQEIANRRTRTITSNNQIEVLDLEACENYLFDIGMVNVKTGVVGPLTEHPQQLITQMNPQSPPKDVHVRPAHGDDGTPAITVSWRAPCDVLEKPIAYNITMTETTFNRSYGVSNVKNSSSTDLSYWLQIQYGGRYQLTVSTSVPGGKPSAPVTFDGPFPIPFPEKISQCHSCNQLTVLWDVPKLPKLVTQKGRHTFVIWLSKDAEFGEPQQFESEDNSYVFSNIEDGGIYYVAVSVKDAEGLLSPMSNPVVVQHVDSHSPLVVIPGSSALAITLTVLVIIVLLLSVLAVFIVRHKRLQTSFLNFASSHYSSSSGAATFQQTMEDADSPVIRGFSDDEPLLVA